MYNEPGRSFSAAKLLQKFGINKDLTVKIKFILIFSGKYWVFAQGCERKFGGTHPVGEGACRNYYKFRICASARVFFL